MRLAIESVFLSVFLIAALYIGPAAILGHSISHSFPYGYSSSDSFQHQVRAEAIKDMGNFRYEASYISKSVEGAVGRYPPLLYHVAVIFSYASGLEVYDSIYFLVLLFPIIAIALFYFMMKDYNKNVAILALPITLLIYSFSPPGVTFSAGFLLGHWPSLLSQVFMILLFWAVSKISFENFYLPIIIAFCAILMAHTSEAVFAGIFLALFAAIRIFSKEFGKKEAKVLLISVTAAVAVSFYYLMVFLNTFGKGEPYSFSSMPVWDQNPGFYIIGFGVLLIPIIIGTAISLFRAKGMQISLIVGISMLVGGFMNYAGFTFRAFQIRFFWPIYLSSLFGFGLYFIFKLVIKKWNIAMSVLASAFVFVIILGFVSIPGVPAIKAPESQGMMDKNHWDMFKWVGSNTEKDAKVYFFYGDMYSQDAVLRNSKRVHAQVEIDGIVSALQNRTVARELLSDIPGDSGGGIAKRKGLFSFEDGTLGIEFYGMKDICDFDYLVFDKVTGQESLSALVQYNLITASNMLTHDFIKKAYENDYVLVLKNSKTGVDCIDTQSF